MTGLTELRCFGTLVCVLIISTRANDLNSGNEAGVLWEFDQTSSLDLLYSIVTYVNHCQIAICQGMSGYLINKNKVKEALLHTDVI